MKKPEVVLLDIGGVLVEYGGEDTVMGWFGNVVDDERMGRIWNDSNALGLFETGRCHADEYAERIVSELNLPVTPQEFLQAFIRFPKGYYPGAEETLKTLSRQYRTVCFSNNNELQWNRLCLALNLDQMFHECYLSHEIGYRKPDREAFLYVIQALSCKPEGIVFFDDNPVNVSMGREVGMDAYRVNGADELAAKLRELELII